MLGRLGTRGPLWVTSVGLLVTDLPLLAPGLSLAWTEPSRLYSLVACGCQTWPSVHLDPDYPQPLLQSTGTLAPTSSRRPICSAGHVLSLSTHSSWQTHTSVPRLILGSWARDASFSKVRPPAAGGWAVGQGQSAVVSGGVACE